MYWNKCFPEHTFQKVNKQVYTHMLLHALESFKGQFYAEEAPAAHTQPLQWPSCESLSHWAAGGECAAPAVRPLPVSAWPLHQKDDQENHHMESISSTLQEGLLEQWKVGRGKKRGRVPEGLLGPGVRRGWWQRFLPNPKILCPLQSCGTQHRSPQFSASSRADTHLSRPIGAAGGLH